MMNKERKLIRQAQSRMAQGTSSDAGRYIIFAIKDGENGVCVISKIERLRIGVQAAMAQLLGADATTIQPPDEFLAVLTDGIAVAKRRLHGANGAVQRFIPRYGINIGIVWAEGAIEDFLAQDGPGQIEHRLVI